jgi:ribosome-binding factor A
MGKNYKHDRLAKTLMNEINYLLANELEDPIFLSINITNIDISKDFKKAYVYFVNDPNEIEKEAAFKVLDKSKSHIRSRVAQITNNTSTPEFVFKYDNTARINKLLNDLE